MLTIISIIVLFAAIALVVSVIRAFTLKPSETPVPNSSELVYQADHWRSKEIFEKRYMKNHLILKVSLTLTIVGGIIIFILKSI